MAANLDEKKQQSVLYITASWSSYSGIYLCAVHAQRSPGLYKLFPNMQLSYRPLLTQGHFQDEKPKEDVIVSLLEKPLVVRVEETILHS